MAKKTPAFWEIRAANYDKLFWVKDDSYLRKIISSGKFKPSDLVLDVGTGTGVVAKAIKPLVKHMVAIDTSHAMLSKGAWEGISAVQWNISDSLFVNHLFDKITARMVFHHIFDDLDRAIIRCYDLLKDQGSILVAEGVPPSDDDDVVDWFARMFAHKEERRVFKSNDIADLLKKNGFKTVKTYVHITKKFSIKNWLDNSGLASSKKNRIMRMHKQAPKKIKKLYHMAVEGSDVFVDSKNVITVAQKG